MPFHTITQPAFSFSGFFWSSVDTIASNWVYVGIITATVGALLTLAFWHGFWAMVRFNHRVAVRRELRSLALKGVVQMDRRVVPMPVRRRQGGKDAA